MKTAGTSPAACHAKRNAGEQNSVSGALYAKRNAGEQSSASGALYDE
jgi:hypothetical protein